MIRYVASLVTILVIAFCSLVKAEDKRGLKDTGFEETDRVPKPLFATTAEELAIPEPTNDLTVMKAALRKYTNDAYDGSLEQLRIVQRRTRGEVSRYRRGERTTGETLDHLQYSWTDGPFRLRFTINTVGGGLFDSLNGGETVEVIKDDRLVVTTRTNSFEVAKGTVPWLIASTHERKKNRLEKTGDYYPLRLWRIATNNDPSRRPDVTIGKHALKNWCVCNDRWLFLRSKYGPITVWDIGNTNPQRVVADDVQKGDHYTAAATTNGEWLVTVCKQGEKLQHVKIWAIPDPNSAIENEKQHEKSTSKSVSANAKP